MPGAILATDQVSKSFGTVRALSNVSIALQPGQVHGIVGENGAGKSTLMKILSGVERPTSGRVLVRGEPVELAHPIDAQRVGISMIHQELNLIEDLSVADNIFLGREKATLGWVDQTGTREAAARLLKSVGSEISPGMKVRSLSIAQKQMIEIAKAVSTNASVLIMDEPTAVLSGRETAALFALMDQLRKAGTAIVYISHLLPEVLRMCDQVTVMRDGQVVQTMPIEQVRQIGERGLASKMVGRALADHFPKREPVTGKIAFEVRNLSSPAGRLRDISFTVAHGEILGFAGLIGAGRTEMAEAICGLSPKTSGEIFIDGQPITIRNVRQSVRAGLAYLSEDRKGTGLTLGMSIAQNMTLASLKRWWIGRRREAGIARSRVADLKIKVGGIHDPVSSLSGGNQQKVALAKWLETSPKVLFVDEPTRGVDIGAKEQIYQLIQSLTRAGMACILISSELNEVIGLSHRIAVMRGGEIATILNAENATEESIMHYAAGVLGDSAKSEAPATQPSIERKLHHGDTEGTETRI
jgi:ribose transport system ATP-binding protein